MYFHIYSCNSVSKKHEVLAVECYLTILPKVIPLMSVCSNLEIMQGGPLSSLSNFQSLRI